jgi:dephospho-CoA kinase
VTVFGNPERLEKLNQLVHPHVFRRERELVDQFAEFHPHGIVVVEAAILIETGNYKAFDRVILVECKEEMQIERAIKRDHLDRGQVLARLRRQMPLAEKRKFADFVIDTSGSKEETLRRVREVYDALRRIEA